MSDWPRYPTDEMSLRLLIEACTINDETGQTHLQDFLLMGTVEKSRTDITEDDGPRIYEVEYEPGKEPHSPQTVIVSLAEELLRLRAVL